MASMFFSSSLESAFSDCAVDQDSAFFHRAEHDGQRQLDFFVEPA